jgi:hypothetical protein
MWAGSLDQGILLPQRVDSGRDLVQAAPVMTSSTAARARLPLVTVLAALAAAGLIASTAVGAGSSRSADLAPVGACGGSTDATASAVLQQRAMRCLVNWARAQHGQRSLSPSSSLQRAAALKGRGVVDCRQVSHVPCGMDATALVRRTGYRYASRRTSTWHPSAQPVPEP